MLKLSLNRFKFSSNIYKRTLNTSNKRQLVPLQNGLIPNTSNPWKQQTDPNGSGLIYWWNSETNETTHLGSPKPQHWIETQDPNGSNLTYWWNPETNQTTALGESRPHYLQQYQQQQQSLPFQQQVQPVTFGRSLIHMVGLGFGVSFGIILIRVFLGI